VGQTHDQTSQAVQAGSVEIGRLMVPGLAFDAGGLIALERQNRRVLGLVSSVLEGNGRLVIPATVLAQVLRNPARQVGLWRMIQLPSTDVVALDGRDAQAVGALLARSGTSDIVDAHVVICAQDSGFAVLTSDPSDIRRLDPELEIIPV
jgi:hypothetical protein